MVTKHENAEECSNPTEFLRNFSLTLPKSLDLTNMNMAAEKFQIWKLKFLDFCVLTHLEQQQPEYQLAIFRQSVGDAALKAIQRFRFQPNEDKNDWHILLRKLEDHCVGERNETYERYKFFCRKQEEGESFESYLSAIEDLVDTCNFGDLRDSLIRDRIVTGLTSAAITKQLLGIRNLTLAKCIDVCRSHYLAEEQLSNMGNAVSILHQVNVNKSQSQPAIDCLFCGRRHVKNKASCPAWGKVCSKCGKRNHFAKCCKSPNVHSITQQPESCLSDTINNLHDRRKLRKSVYADMVVNGHTVKFQLDTGATANLIPKKYVPEEAILDTTSKLTMWNGATFIPAGTAILDVTNPKSGNVYKLNFIVVEEELMPILGVEAVTDLDLININFDNFVYASVCAPTVFFDKYPRVFDDGLGQLPGKVKLSLNQDVRPRVLPTRRVPLAIRERFKQELDRLLALGVIAKVDGPSDWVSQIAVVLKRNGDLRICIDPKPLNEALRREHFQLPVLDDLLSELAGAKYFTKVDLSSAFWHLELEEESSMLTTFSTPYGRFRWLRLPFGLKVSSEIFQKRLKQAIDDLPGVKCVADDILIFGSTVSEHDNNLENFLSRCERDNIKLKKEKFEYCTQEVIFHGHLLTADGIKPDPEKIRAINEMPPPVDSKGASRLCGMVTYLSRFLPKLADIIEPIRRLTHKDTEWSWAGDQREAFEKIKILLTKAPVLAYYDPKLPLCIQCDSSQFGLGAALLQNGKPLDFRSRTLTPTEERYAQIEKEMLAVVFALEKFNDYTFGQKTTVYTDHQPLVSIVKKPLHIAPRRLQRMMIRLQKYDFEVQYMPGKDMVLADTLSRAPVSGTLTELEFENVNVVHELIAGKTFLERIKQATNDDAALQTLKRVISEGWPSDKTMLPEEVRPYFAVRDELTSEDDFLFRGDRIIIPKCLQLELMQRVHRSHLGINACLTRARECVYWPNMNGQLKDFISRCRSCREHDVRQTREPMERRDIPQRPWQIVSADLFHYGGKQFLVTVDYYTDFFEVDELALATSGEVIDKLRNHFARYGIPETFISDGGPQFGSLDFKKFAKSWEFEHHLTTPYRSQSNGKAESAVKEAKKIFKKAASENMDPKLILLEHRNTASGIVGLSPAQRMFHRRIRTQVPMTAQLLQPTLFNQENLTRRLRERQEKYKTQYDKHSRKMIALKVGDVVWVEPLGPGKCIWEKGKVIDTYGRNSFIVEIDGKIYRRSRVHLRKATDDPNKAVRDLRMSESIQISEDEEDIIQDGEENDRDEKAGSTLVGSRNEDGERDEENEEAGLTVGESRNEDAPNETVTSHRDRRPPQYLSRHYELF